MLSQRITIEHTMTMIVQNATVLRAQHYIQIGSTRWRARPGGSRTIRIDHGLETTNDLHLFIIAVLRSTILDHALLHFKNRGRLLTTTTACFSLSARPVQEPCSSLMCQPQELGRAVRIPHLAYAQMPDDTRTHSPVARFRYRKSGRTVRARHQNIIFRPMY